MSDLTLPREEDTGPRRDPTLNQPAGAGAVAAVPAVIPAPAQEVMEDPQAADIAPDPMADDANDLASEIAPSEPRPEPLAKNNGPYAIQPPATNINGFSALDDLPSFSERYAAAWLQRTVETDMWGYSAKVERELTEQLLDALPDEARGRLQSEFAQIEAEGSIYRPAEPRKRAAIFREMKQVDPEGRMRAVAAPVTEREFEREVLDRRRAAYDEGVSVLEVNGGGFAGFLGGLARDMADPINLAIAPIGLQGSVARVIAAETVLGGVAAAASLPREFRVADELDLARPNVAGRITTEALASGALAGVFTGVVRGAAAYKQRRAASQYGKPEGVTEAQHEQAVADATQRLQDDLPERTPRAAAAAERTFSDVAEAGRGFTTVIGPDGKALRRVGTRAWRNNNPGNIEFGEFARSRGAIGTDGRFAVFPTYEIGRRAKASLLWETSSYRDRTIASAINRYAPPFENNTNAYTAAITQALGVSANTRMSSLNLRQRDVMLDTMERVEGFRPGTENGVRMPMPTRQSVSSTPAAEFTGYRTSRGFTSAGQVRTSAGTRIDVEYQVVDASTLVRATGDLQPRDRSQTNSDAWISQTAAELDPALLMPTPTADRGAPLVGPDNVIESGNGRVAAITRAATRHPDRFDAYRQQIVDAGFDIPDDVATPVLVGRRTSDLTPEQRREFVIEGQDSGVARMTPVERSRAEAAGLNTDTLARLDPSKPLTDAANTDFARAALARLPRSERNAFVTPEGRLNADGRAALERALFARAFNDPALLRQFTEGDAAELKSLLDALFDASPAWARLAADIADGTVKPEFDITGHVLEAMRLIAASRAQAGAEGRKIASVLVELLDDVDLLDGAVSPLTRALVGRFWSNGRAAAQKDIAQFLTRYADEARRVGRSDAGLFGDGPDALDALRAIDPGTFDDIAEIGAARGMTQAPRADASETIPEGIYADGAASAEAVQADALALADLRSSIDAPRQDAAARDAGADNIEALQQAVDVQRGEMGQTRAEALADGDFDMPIGNGQTIRASELLDDLEDDQVLDTVISTCAARGAA